MTNVDKFSIEDVVSTGSCIGCGACSFASDGKVTVAINEMGLYSASGVTRVAESVDSVCPFSDSARTEDELSRSLYSSAPNWSSVLGWHSDLYAGRVSDDSFRRGSSSGGLVSWFARELLSEGIVDGIIHVKSQSDGTEPLFSFGLSFSDEELLSNRKSIYYPVEFSEALESARSRGGKYAFIGIPCHVKAIRLLQLEDEWLRDNIVVTLGLVCGHMKSTGFAQLLAWQTGVNPVNLLSVDFRVKDLSATANRYKFSATSKVQDQSYSRSNVELVGANWGHAFFQPNACNYCDDIFAECADVSFGDAWLAAYQSDPLGHNVVVVRTELAARVFSNGVDSGQIVLDVLSEADAIATQAGNVRHRRDGLAVRLADDESLGLAHPRKRVVPSLDHVSERRLRLVRLRRESSAMSFGAFEAAKRRNNIQLFYRRMAGVVRRYDWTSASGVVPRLRALIPLSYQGVVRRFFESARGSRS